MWRGRLRTRTRLVLARADNLQNRLSMLSLLSLWGGGGKNERPHEWKVCEYYGVCGMRTTATVALVRHGLANDSHGGGTTQPAGLG